MNKKLIFIISSLITITSAAWALEDSNQESLSSNLKSIEVIADHALKSGVLANMCSAAVILKEQISADGPSGPIEIAGAKLVANVDLAYNICAAPKQAATPSYAGAVDSALRNVRTEARHIAKGL